MSIRPSRILCIDDDEDVLNLLRRLLEEVSYEVRCAESAVDAPDLVVAHEPDIILLDVHMPNVDGFSACTMLKSDPRTTDVPVIFLSADSNPNAVSKGLRCGAVDFIAKPIQPVELMLRVGIHTRIRDQEAQLRRYSEQLETLVEERTRALIHADRLVSLGTLAAGTAHEINNPTSVIRGNIDTFRLYWSKIEPIVAARVEVDGDRALRTVLREMPKLLDGMTRGTERIATIVNGLLRFGARRPAEKTSVDLAEVISETLTLVHNKLKYRITVDVDELALPLVQGSANELTQVFVNLLGNAADAIGPENSGEIRITADVTDEKVFIHVRDDGPGIPKKLEMRITEPFFTTKKVGEGTGLGLPICIGIAEDHGGRLTIRNHPDGGCIATLELPRPQRTDDQAPLEACGHRKSGVSV